MNSPFKLFRPASLRSTGRHTALTQLDRQAREAGNPACRRRGWCSYRSHAAQSGTSQPHRASRRLLEKLIVAGLAAALTIVTLPGASASTPPVLWLAANSSVANLAAVNPSLAAADLGAPGTMIQGTARLTRNPVRTGFSSLPTERWTSEARFAADAAAGAIPSYVRVAHYDNEKWSATPLAEQQNPSWYEKAFCQIAHAHGLLCATGPARDLCPVAYPNSGTLNNCYLRHDLAGGAARYADYTDIQGQANELRGTSAYAAFIAAAAAKAKAANPRNITFGNLSATPARRSVSASEMNADARAVFGTGTGQVAGFYITITSAGAATTAQFVRLFEP